MTSLTRPLVIGGLALVLSAGLWAMRGPRAHSPLPLYGQVTPFVGLDQDARAMTLEALQGAPWIADFIFTRCAGQCPLMSRRMAALQTALADTPIRFVSFTVDPEYDTPARLAAYATMYGAHPDRWRFVTTEPVEIQRLSQDVFRLPFVNEGTPEEPITHSVRLVLVDQAGRIRGFYDAMDEEAVARLQDDAKRLAGR